MNDPLLAAAVIAIGALWLVFMALPNLRHPPRFNEPTDQDKPEEKQTEEQEKDS